MFAPLWSFFVFSLRIFLWSVIKSQHALNFLFCYPVRTRPEFYASWDILVFLYSKGHKRSSLNIILCTCYPNWNPWPRSFPSNRKRNSRPPTLWSQYTKWEQTYRMRSDLLNMPNQLRANFLNIFHLFMIHPPLRHRSVELPHLVFKTNGPQRITWSLGQGYF